MQPTAKTISKQYEFHQYLDEVYGSIFLEMVLVDGCIQIFPSSNYTWIML